MTNSQRDRRLALAGLAVALALGFAKARADELPAGVWFARDRAAQVSRGAQQLPRATINNRLSDSRQVRSRSTDKVSIKPLDVRPAPQVVGEAMLHEAERWIGSRNPTGLRAAWCGAFMSMVARRVGAHVPPAPNLARSWAYAGQRLSGPAIGAVAVQAHHVGLVQAVTARSVVIVSGNFGHRVGVGIYAARHMIFVRV